MDDKKTTELADALAESVNAWWRQHLSHSGPHCPYTPDDAARVVRCMVALPPYLRNDAIAHFARAGFTGAELPARVPIRRKLECDWITVRAGKRDVPVILHAYDIGGDWNGWAEPLFTEDQLRAFMLAERGDAPFDQQGDYIITEKKGEPGAFYMLIDSEAEAFEDRFAILEPGAYTLADGTKLYNASGSGYTWSWA